jgi:hypothetical protein
MVGVGVPDVGVPRAEAKLNIQVVYDQVLGSGVQSMLPLRCIVLIRSTGDVYKGLMNGTTVVALKKPTGALTERELRKEAALLM